jgi:hypothetical protein
MCFCKVSPLIRFELLALDASSAHKCAPHSVTAAEHPALLLLDIVLASSYPNSVVQDGRWARNAVVSATAGTRAGRLPHVRPLLLCTCAVVTRHGRPLLLPCCCFRVEVDYRDFSLSLFIASQRSNIRITLTSSHTHKLRITCCSNDLQRHPSIDGI